jgi:hypothetical protein
MHLWVFVSISYSWMKEGLYRHAKPLYPVDRLTKTEEMGSRKYGIKRVQLAIASVDNSSPPVAEVLG